MVSPSNYVTLLSDTEHCIEERVGGKAAKLARLRQAGYPVPEGFCLSTSAYEAFIEESQITKAIQVELGRKPLDEMRWEELWDTALRIRSLFLRHPLPLSIRESVRRTLEELSFTGELAVRSSAVGEDSVAGSFAGLHDSFIGVVGLENLEDSIRLVWASLWSDAALLYRRELGLDPLRSKMAVLIQKVVDRDHSGVGFGRDPRDASNDCAIIEAVPGRCERLVDGVVEPDHWQINRQTKDVVEFRSGSGGGEDSRSPVLDTRGIHQILEALLSIENVFGWAPDIEWTGTSSSFTLLQARPITTLVPDNEDKRSWYLSLSPNDARLRELRQRVGEVLIPQLESEGRRLALEAIEEFDEVPLADAIEERFFLLEKWRKIYWDDFIPFAHGVRRLATYYNDAVRPEDPYEFVGLLNNQPLLAAKRNAAIGTLAGDLASKPDLREKVGELLSQDAADSGWDFFRTKLLPISGAKSFVADFEDLNRRFFDITCDRQRLQDEPTSILETIYELSYIPGRDADALIKLQEESALLEDRLLHAVGDDGRSEALERIETGRVSWKLRDDDNLLLARVESQALRGLQVAKGRLQETGKLSGEREPREDDTQSIVDALRGCSQMQMPLRLDPESVEPTLPASSETSEKPRQLIGQPASPGLATGSVRVVRDSRDYRSFRRGEVLICDAIQPAMTHLVPLACAIVERRGGMLIHGAIIARELGIPCVNGVRLAADGLQNGTQVTVDGHLGIVVVGEAEFEMELRQRARP